MLDALPGSAAESVKSEPWHRQDHPQDLIAQLQVRTSLDAKFALATVPSSVVCRCNLLILASQLFLLTL